MTTQTSHLTDDFNSVRSFFKLITSDAGSGKNEPQKITCSQQDCDTFYRFPATSTYSAVSARKRWICQAPSNYPRDISSD